MTTPVYYQIRQLVISPSETFLAICTEHTVHIAVLPDSSRLKDTDRSPLKLKTYQLGPTTHVIPESPLATILWHPLAAATSSTDCLVTVTAEAAVRVWELDRSNHWSFERPSLAIDLRKLADGVSGDQDFEPSGFGKNRGFSVDDFDMEVAAACFGGQGLPEEDAWAGMTLWTAMRNGDIYALCPLLPSKWQPTVTTIPSLSMSAVSRMATIAGDDVDDDDRRAADQQYEWVQEIDNDEPLTIDSMDGNVQYEVRLRPQNPSAIPRLQGPFELGLDDEDADLEISDIFSFPSQLDERDLVSGEDDFDDMSTNIAPSIPFTTLCLATTSNVVHIALDLDGVSGQWLPKRGRSTFGVPSPDSKELSLVESIDLQSASSVASSAPWPIFTTDPLNSYGVFVTTSSHIHSISISDWMSRLAAELEGDGIVDSGLRTRLDTSCQHQVLNLDEIISVTEPMLDGLSAPCIINNTSLGYFLLTSSGSAAFAASFDQAHLRQSLIGSSSPTLASISPEHLNRQFIKIAEGMDTNDYESLPTRAPYAPPNILYENPMLPIEQMRKNISPQLRKTLTEKPMRLSPACLDVMTSAHRTISAQTSQIEIAAAELFRKCERLKEELINRVKQMSELADKLQHLHNLNGEATEERKTHEERITIAQEKQKTLVQRYETLRRKAARIGSGNRELSVKEIAWVDEINTLGQNVGLSEEDEGGMAPLLSRFDTVSSSFVFSLSRASVSV